MTISSLGIMQWAQVSFDETTARSMGVVTFALAGIFLALGCNDDLGSVFSMDTLDNGKLMQMCLFSVVATIAVTEIGLFQRIFDTVPLNVNQWVTCLVVASAILWVMEVEKLIRRRGAASAEPVALAEPQPVAVPAA